MDSEPERGEPKPSLQPDQVDRLNWARHDPRALIERLTEAIESIDRARLTLSEIREQAQSAS
jgi:hypothetical protein